MRPPGRQGARADAQFIRTLTAARLAADVLDVPTVLVARTDALSATLLTTDVDEHDAPFITGERTSEGFYRVQDGLDAAIARALAYAPYADMLWCETSTPDLGEAQEFADGDPRRASRASSWPTTARRRSTGSRRLDDAQIAAFQERARRDGLPVPVHHARRLPLAERGHVRARARLPRAGDDARTSSSRSASSRWRPSGYTATKHQREVGAGYFDQVAQAIAARTPRRSRCTARRRKSNSRRAPPDVLSVEALAFVERLHRELNPERGAAARRPRRAARLERPSFVRAPASVHCRARSRRPAGPAGGDHGAGRAEDDDQRAQLGRAGLHGRLRGRELADVGQRAATASATSTMRCAARSRSTPARRATD